MPGAQFNLGVLYYNGKGVEQSHAEAAKWFRLAAEQENERAQLNLGSLYYNGKGVEQNHTEAAKWFHLVAEQKTAGRFRTSQEKHGIKLPKNSIWEQ